MRRNYNTQRGLMGVPKLLEAGLPAGPLEQPVTFAQTRKGAKLHGDPDCHRLRNSLWEWVQRDFREVTESEICQTCVDGPPDTETKTYVEHAHQVFNLSKQFIDIRAQLLADRDRVPVEQVTDTACDLSAPVELSSASWEFVAKLEALQRAFATIESSPHVHTTMLNWMGPLSRQVNALHSQLVALAAAATDDGAMARSCVIDLMGTYDTHRYGGSANDTPEASQPIVENPDRMPQLFVTSSEFGIRCRSNGFADLVLAAWETWREEVRATGDLAAAKTAAMAATKIDQTEPGHVVQVKNGVPCTPIPASGSLWDWQVAEWRLIAREQLATVLDEWAATFTANLEEAAKVPAKIIAINKWSAEARAKSNASTLLLAQVPLVVNTSAETGLAIVPGYTVAWFEKFDVRGAVEARGYGHSKNRVKVIGDALETDTRDTLEVAFRMWVPPRKDCDGFRVVNTDPMAKLENAVSAAQGITVT